MVRTTVKKTTNGGSYTSVCGACMLMLVSCMIKQLITDLDIDLMFALKA